MQAEGFSIFCPNCLEWTDFEFSPEEVLINSKEEFGNLITKLNQEKGIKNKKILRCDKPNWKCPAKFETFIFSKNFNINDLTDISATWFEFRIFKLYKKDRIHRYDDYKCLLGYYHKLQRHRHVLINQLIDDDFLSQSLAGLSIKLNAPVTLYSPNFYEFQINKSSTFWLPIEQYTQIQQTHIPEKYNPICKIVRQKSIDEIVRKFNGKINIDTCPIGFKYKGTCGGNIPACLKKDWNKCPAFLIERDKKSACYFSDKSLINQLIAEWKDDNYIGYSYHRCWLNFYEIAVPIVVHDIIIGVIITGQFIDENEIKFSVINSKFKLSKPERERINKFKKSVTERLKSKERFEISNQNLHIKNEIHVKETINTLQNYTHQLNYLLSKLYYNYRIKSEELFKKEILHDLSILGSCTDKMITATLKRMVEFWGFKSSLLIYSKINSNNIYVLAKADLKSETFWGNENKIIGSFDKRLLVQKSINVPFIFDSQKNYSESSSLIINLLYNLLMKMFDDTELNIPKGHFYYGILSKTNNHIFVLLLCVRDTDAISTLPTKIDGNISQLAKEMIFNTGIDIIKMFDKCLTNN